MSIYDIEIENTLKNMKTNTGFFKAYYDRERVWMLNNHPNKVLRDTEVQISGNKYNISPSLKKVSQIHLTYV